MNATVFQAAREAGCSLREAEVVATYVESEGAADAAAKLRTTRQVVVNYLAKARRHTGAPHNAALVAALLARPTDNTFTQAG